MQVSSGHLHPAKGVVFRYSVLRQFSFASYAYRAADLKKPQQIRIAIIQPPIASAYGSAVATPSKTSVLIWVNAVVNAVVTVSPKYFTPFHRLKRDGT